MTTAADAIVASDPAARPDLRPASPMPPAIAAHSRLTLCRLVIRQHEKDFTVRQYGTGTGIVTGRLGVEAVRLLNCGMTIKEVTEHLAAEKGCNAAEIDLSRIVAALSKARLIHAVDGVPLGAAASPGLAAWWRYEGFPRLWKRVCESASALPFGWLHATMAVMDAIYVNPKRDLILRTMAANMAKAFPDRSADEVQRTARDSFDHKVRIARRRYVARLAVGPALIGRSDARARKAADWFMGKIGIEGTENLEAARAQGKGVILCGFHFGFILSLPFVLARHGYAVTAMGLVHRDYDEQFYHSLAKRLTDLGYARFLMLPTIDLKSMSTLMRLLGRGEIVLLFGDAYIDMDAKRDLLRYLKSDLKLYRPSQTAVELLGATVSANKGLGWLHETTGAPVVPMAILEGKGGREALVLRPALPSSAARTAEERIAATVRASYAELETLVRENPTQWWYWKSLHKMQVEREPGRTEPTSS